MKSKIVCMAVLVGAISLSFTGCSREYSNKPLPIHENRPTPEQM